MVPVAPCVVESRGARDWHNQDMGRRQHVSSGSPFEATIGFSRALRLGGRIWVSGTGPVFPDGHCPDEAAAQARRCFEIIEGALAEAGATWRDVVRTRMFLTDVTDADAVGAVHGELFADVRPAATMVIVAGLIVPAWKVEIEAEAALPE
jgi:enamine deaminase RidA (YjgF/YER057c/UK114 family)